MNFTEHARRVACLLMAVTALLVWRVSRAEVLSADGLRYTSQASKIANGDWRGGLVGSVDHPMYPLQIAGIWTIVGMPDTPVGWQNAAWTASLIHGILIVIPLYWIGRNLFGDPVAWLGVVAFYAVPHTSQILADALSESTFLHFWCWSVGFALEFLKRGRPGWLLGVAASGAMAYWTRPEGLLICIALGLTILVTPLLPSTRVDWPRLGQVLAMLGLATAIFSVPVILSRGSIATKPAIAKVLGLQKRAAVHAVERERPLDPNQTELETWAIASSAFYQSTKQATTGLGLALALIGFITWTRPNAAAARSGLLIVFILSLAAAALIRLYATQGYCAPRHTLVPSQILLIGSGAGLYWVSSRLMGLVAKIKLVPNAIQAQPGPAIWLMIASVWCVSQADAFLKPIGHDALGYRLAGEYLQNEIGSTNEPIIDLTGWAPYYANHPGYTFKNINDAFTNQDARFVVVRKSHLVGPWDYCRTMEKLTQGATQIATFPKNAGRRQSQVILFELNQTLSRNATATVNK
ncbi:MAG: glycosyltransferase family 39 protein [Planctomycetota bacterium]|nr:MAG: hypothetical protein DWI24_03390 [Planctomycetota bacterium]